MSNKAPEEKVTKVDVQYVVVGNELNPDRNDSTIEMLLEDGYTLHNSWPTRYSVHHILSKQIEDEGVSE